MGEKDYNFTKVFYHNDLDGQCAAAIIYKEFSPSPAIQFIEMDYDKSIDIESIYEKTKIYIVDFSFKPYVMEKILEKTKNVIWIDHHKTAFEYRYSQNLEGLRDIKFAGCELTWKYFYGNKAIPLAIRLIADRDIWAFRYGEDTDKFVLSLSLHDTNPVSASWNHLFSNKDQIINKMIKEGELLALYRNSLCKEYVEKYGFEVKFEGYKCFALGLLGFGSTAFGEKIKEYDICISFEFNGDKWIISLYSEKVDVSEIAKKYGGGGHFGAAGFSNENLIILPAIKEFHEGDLVIGD